MSAKFNEKGFLGKVANYCVGVGKGGVEQALRLYYALDSEKCSGADRTIICGALTYLLSPFDMIPDLTPVLGYTDDMVIIAAALTRVAHCIDDTVKAKAWRKVNEIF